MTDAYAASLSFPGSDSVSPESTTAVIPKLTLTQCPTFSVFTPHWKLALGPVPHSEVGVGRGDMAHQWPNILYLALN